MSYSILMESRLVIDGVGLGSNHSVLRMIYRWGINLTFRMAVV